MIKKKITKKKEIKLSSKASRYRSSWIKRAKKMGVDPSVVPSTTEIKAWLDSNDPYICYLSKGYLVPSIVELDHKIPISRGGAFSLDNVGITSRFYNNAKGDMTEKEFKKLLKCLAKWEDKGNTLLLRLIRSNKIYGKR